MEIMPSVISLVVFLNSLVLFSIINSPAGASITAKWFSIIQTAVINNINVEKYLNYVFENINKEPIENLLPYSKNIKDKLK